MLFILQVSILSEQLHLLMWGATTLKLKKKCIKFLKNICQSCGVKHNGGGGGRLQQRPMKVNNIMNIINIIKMLLISRDNNMHGKTWESTDTYWQKHY